MKTEIKFTSKIIKKLSPYFHTTADGGNELIYFCPLCGDKEKHDHGHLYVERETGKWHCFYCGAGSSSVIELLRIFGIDISYIDKIEGIVEYKNQDADDIALYSNSQGVTKEVRIKIQEQLNEFEENSHFFEENHPAYIYLHDARKLSDSEIKKHWKLFDKFPDYVFWECRDEEGNLVFYSGRVYTKNDTISKYRHLRHCPILLTTFNNHRNITSMNLSEGSRELIFLVEGLFDAIHAPARAIPLFGKSRNVNLLNEIVPLLKRENLAPICTLDNEEVKDNLKLAKYLFDNGIKEVYLFKLEGTKDFGEATLKDLTRDEINERLIRYYGHNENLIKFQLTE